MTALRLVVAFVVACAAARAEVLLVPGEFGTIQAAVNFAQQGDEIVISAGTYDEVLLIASKTDLRLRGKGKVIVAGTGAAGPTIQVSDSASIVFERLIVPGAKQQGFSLDDADGTVVRRCRIEGSVGAAIRLHGSDDVLIEDVTIEGAGDDAITLDLGDRLTLRRVKITGGEGDAVTLLAGVGHVIERLRSLDAGGRGMTLGADVSAGTVSRCVLKACAQSAVVSSASTTLLEDNRLLDPVEDGFVLEGGTGCVLLRNRIVRPSSGVIITAGAHQLLDNRLVQTGQESVIVGGAPGQVISGNRIAGSLDDGIFLDADSDSPTITDNRVASTAANAFIIVADDAQVVGNRAKGAGINGFHVAGVSGIYVGNSAKGSQQFDLQDDAGGNTYVDNDFGTTQFP